MLEARPYPGYPTHEELAAIGLTGQQFFDRYILPEAAYVPKWWQFWKPRPSVARFAAAVLDNFYRDYPALKRRP
jgi:hypothetical protein